MAGPKASTIAERVKSRLARRGYTLDLWDGRRIAEYIVDRLLIDERFIARVGNALPNLRRISEQNAASARVPALDPLYGGRVDEEADILSRLDSEKCVVRLAGLESLRACDIRLNGYRLNVLDLLASHKTMLVLDNVGIDLDVEALSETCGPDSRILITSQVKFGSSVVPIGFVSRDRARKILSANVPQPCPDQVLDAILQAVEGHPLVLRMLNRFAVEGQDWPAVERQCLYVVGAADEKRRTVAGRILDQHLDVLGPELAFFA